MFCVVAITFRRRLQLLRPCCGPVSRRPGPVESSPCVDPATRVLCGLPRSAPWRRPSCPRGGRLRGGVPVGAHGLSRRLRVRPGRCFVKESQACTWAALRCSACRRSRTDPWSQHRGAPEQPRSRPPLGHAAGPASPPVAFGLGGRGRRCAAPPGSTTLRAALGLSGWATGTPSGVDGAPVRFPSSSRNVSSLPVWQHHLRGRCARFSEKHPKDSR